MKDADGPTYEKPYSSPASGLSPGRDKFCISQKKKYKLFNY